MTHQPDSAILVATANHLWQSTLMALVAALLVLIIGRGRARVRHAIWLAASMKFLIPFALLAALGGLVPWPIAATAPDPLRVSGVTTLVQPFAFGDVELSALPVLATSAGTVVPTLLFVVWACGAVIAVLLRITSWRRVAKMVSQSPQADTGRVADAWRRLQRRSFAVPVVQLASAHSLEPCIFGIFNPVLLWPAGVADRLSDAQLEAVLIHELSHIRRRDNLTSTCHIVIETIFWFYPPVWWIGARLLAERERACDQNVVSQGCFPAAYAESLLQIGAVCLESRAACVAGVAGSGLVARIEAIMMHRSQSLGWQRTLLLTAVGTTAVGGPLVAGSLHAAMHDRPLVAAVTPWINPIPTPIPTPVAADVVPVHSTKATESRANESPRHEPSNGPHAPQAPTGRIDGLVTDQTGAPLPDSTVIAVSRASAAPRTALSGVDGRYTIPSLTPGTYDVKVTHDMFKSVTQPLEISGGKTAAGNATLPIGGVAETVKTVGHRDRAHAPNADPLAEAQARDQIVKDSSAAAGYFDLASLYYSQERFTESEQMVTRAVELVDQQAAVSQPGASAQQQGGDVAPPQLIRRVSPVYTSAAIASGIAGTVVLEATISTSGSMKNVRVVQSVPGLDAAAIGAIRQMLFRPTTLHGVPIETGLAASIIFELR